jgi:N-methylhydantoinase B
MAGQKWETCIHRRDGRVEHIPSKRVFTLQAGDRLAVRTGGGGGLGDPLRRELGAVLDDVVDGKISLESSRAKYGVVISPDGAKVDIAATNELRAQMAAARGPITWLFDRGEGLRE